MKWLLIIPGIVILVILVIVIQENKLVTTSQIEYEEYKQQEQVPIQTNINNNVGGSVSNHNSQEKLVAIDNMRVTYGYNGKATVYWEVLNGIGCCSTFGCDYSRFRAYCLDIFNLYDLYLDGVKINMDIDYGYEYKCENKMPYNFVEFNNLQSGIHNVTIYQKECSNDIIDKETIIFEMQ